MTIKIGEWVVNTAFISVREWSFSAVASQGFDGTSKYGNVWAKNEDEAVKKIGELLTEAA